MKSILKIVSIIILAQLFNLNAADNGEYKGLNLQLLPQDMKNEILGFLGDPNAVPEAQILEKIKELQNLSLVNKDLSRLAQDALKKYEARTNEYLNGLTKQRIYPLDAALTLKTPFAAKWLKNKALKAPSLQQKIDINLLWAAEHRYKDIIKFLINSGANLNIQDDSGNTALMHAVDNGDKDIVEMLIKAGADLNIQDDSGYTALSWIADSEDRKDIAQMLIDAGAKINFGNEKI